jgi:hypothetical protein
MVKRWRSVLHGERGMVRNAANEWFSVGVADGYQYLYLGLHGRGRQFERLGDGYSECASPYSNLLGKPEHHHLGREFNSHVVQHRRKFVHGERGMVRNAANSWF